MSFDLKKAIASIAPTLATMLGGPLAGTAVLALEEALGLAPGSGSEAVTSAMQKGMTPEAIAAVRAADQRHVEVMQQQGIDLAKINADYNTAMTQAEMGDRDSARKLQIAAHSKWPGVLSFVTTVAVLGVIAARMYGKDLPSDATTVQLIGSLTTGWGVCLAYWFGTTRGSADKNNMLAQSVPPNN